MKIIICGAGQVGWQIARHLSGERNDITIVDTDAELIRRAVDLTYGGTDADAFDAALDQSFGTWGSDGPDGEEFVEAIRPARIDRFARW